MVLATLLGGHPEGSCGECYVTLAHEVDLGNRYT